MPARTAGEEMSYVKDIGSVTRRKDNTRVERCAALSLLVNQVDLEGWHPPLLRWEQQIEELMEMLGIEPEWLTTDDVEPVQKIKMPKLLRRETEEAWGVDE